MATATLRPLAYASSPTFLGSPITDEFFPTMVTSGDADVGVCLQVFGDGKFLDGNIAGTDSFSFALYFEDQGQIPLTATINSVTFQIRHSGLTASEWLAINLFILPLATAFTTTLVDSSLTTAVSLTFTTNPTTVSQPWLRSDLFNNGDAGGQAAGGWLFQPSSNNVPIVSYTVDSVALLVDYSGGGDPETGLRYNLDVDEPPIRRFDGVTDKLIAKIPKALV